MRIISQSGSLGTGSRQQFTLNSQMVFDKCELRAAGSGRGISVPGTHGRIQQYQMVGPIPESLEGTETVGDGG